MEVNGFGGSERPGRLGTEVAGRRAGRRTEFTIEKFGVDRCMFESNFR
jgi:hypothetical protein